MSSGRQTIAKDELIDWLKKPCNHMYNQYEDPGYSQYYRGYFNRQYNKINDVQADILVSPPFIDIDDMPHYESTYDDTLHQYADHVLDNSCSKYSYVVLPGSNHSNANFFYKLISDVLDNVEPFDVPYVSSEPSKGFCDEYKKIDPAIDKRKTYEFVKKYS